MTNNSKKTSSSMFLNLRNCEKKLIFTIKCIFEIDSLAIVRIWNEKFCHKRQMFEVLVFNYKLCKNKVTLQGQLQGGGREEQLSDDYIKNMQRNHNYIHCCKDTRINDSIRINTKTCFTLEVRRSLFWVMSTYVSHFCCSRFIP